jgi:type I restriction enzyme S subunit
MIDGLKPYPAMKDSGVEWLGEVPAHWEVQRLRNLVDMRVSNVDKHTKDGEEPVRLCNYVDVYKNDYIHPSMGLMGATATRDEVERFHLAVGDVLITKDSEAWNDIGVPALVCETAADLVSGYHLALLRPFEKHLSGEYLLRALQSTAVQYQFHVEARGVTRYGLSHAAIKSVWLSAPPLPEQADIVRFLDYADRRIRRYIRAKQKLIKLLEEQKQAIIHRAVTRGLDPDMPTKDSGVEWLGEVPEHWGFDRGKYYFREVDVRSIAGEEELLSVSHLTGVTPRSQKNITMFKAESYVGSKVCAKGQIAVNTMWAWMAAIGVSKFHGLVSPSYHTYEQLGSGAFADEYLDLLLRSNLYKMFYTINSSGITTSRLRLYPDDFLNIRFLCPPHDEQNAIIDWLHDAIADIDSAIKRADREIELLSEYRTRMLADVVTGKLDVREAAAEVPAAGILDTEAGLNDAFDRNTDEDLDDLEVNPAGIEI